MVRKPVFNITELEEVKKLPEVKVDKRLEGKEFVAKKQYNGFYSIMFTAGGEVPDVLKGFYTTGMKAEQAVKAYLLTRAPSAS